VVLCYLARMPLTMDSRKAYSAAFYRSIAAESLQAAECIAPLLAPLNVQSVVDFGCGSGTWLHTFRRLGVGAVRGLDQFDPAGVELLIGRDEYQRVDLAREVRLAREYDLAICLEVGEHIAPDASATLVANLVRASRRVLFSAATPGQGGVEHINERPLADWLRLFAGHGYVASDFVRAAIAERKLRVEPWYRYNTLFFLREAELAAAPEIVARHRVNDAAGLSARVALGWRLRSALVAALPVPAVTFLANCKHSLRDSWTRS
jgi:SAM-dependent methyltransferase